MVSFGDNNLSTNGFESYLFKRDIRMISNHLITRLEWSHNDSNRNAVIENLSLKIQTMPKHLPNLSSVLKQIESIFKSETPF